MSPDKAQIDGEAGQPVKRFRSVPMPEQMLDALQLLRYIGTAAGRSCCNPFVCCCRTVSRMVMWNQSSRCSLDG